MSVSYLNSWELTYANWLQEYKPRKVFCQYIWEVKILVAFWLVSSSEDLIYMETLILAKLVPLLICYLSSE